MKLWCAFLLCIVTLTSVAQQKEVTGIVFDKESKARIAKVNVRNTTSGQAVYNNFKGEFSIKVSVGDVLIFSKTDHHSDTLTVKSFLPLVVYMKAVAIQLNEVSIRDTLLSPMKRYRALKSDYNQVFGTLNQRDLLTASPGVGAGISIDALYNLFSRRGKNAEHLREVMERDYLQSVIDARFNKSYVAGITYLKEPELSDFMLKYRPGYYLVTTASEYEFVTYVRNSFKRYRKNPRAFELAPLPSIFMEVK
ncbi:hypothetical protein DYU05_11235 [Mucilaginibacter terrenus]|uniref:Carboxypeptidase-like regulatory domain-containing protein n=1 Tax=Mucilaginibacter terrenus TaxID=2482727 RepID=A0A3E2NP14_9SPHI|nr:hypothetical protein [Mucilaginibacter terrenus]RFZ82739.1 hypothetical protein DYU05_11235 [Mucilaginibacter terrenus]